MGSIADDADTSCWDVRADYELVPSSDEAFLVGLFWRAAPRDSKSEAVASFNVVVWAASEIEAFLKPNAL